MKSISSSSIYRIAGVAILAVAVYITASMFVSAEASPVITTSIKNSSDATITSALVGASVRGSVQIASSTASTPQGTVDFHSYPNTTCAGSPSTQSDVALVNGAATSSATVLTAAGLSYKVHYDGDVNNIAADGACMPLTATSNVVGITTTLSTTSASVLAGSSVNASTILNSTTANAAGTIKYVVYSDASCTVPVQGAGVKSVTNGIAPNSDTVQFNNPGTFRWQAVYSGDANNTAATSTCGNVLTVTAVPSTKNNPTISIGLSSTSIAIGSSVFGNSTLTDETANAGGSVSYKVYTNNSCTTLYGNAGSQTVTNGNVPNSAPFQFVSAGTYYWQTSYSGDANNNAATSSCSSALTVSSIPNPTQTGRIIVDKVTVPTGDTTSFSFAVTGAGYSSFSLADATIANDQTLNVGTYTVSENSMTGWTFTSASCGKNGLATSTYSPGSGIVIAANDIVRCTFTNTKNATSTPGNNSLSGTVYNDKNKNGTRDSGEEGLAGWTINLYGAANFNKKSYDNQLKVTTSDASGNYSFTGLANGTYSIEQVIKKGWHQNTEDFKSVAIANGAGKSGLDFGDYLKKAQGNGNGNDSSCKGKKEGWYKHFNWGTRKDCDKDDNKGNNSWKSGKGGHGQKHDNNDD